MRPDAPIGEPTLKVERYGSTFSFTPEDGWTVNGEPYDPDEDGVHQPSDRSWGHTVTIPVEPTSSFFVDSEMEKGRRFAEIVAEYETLWSKVLRDALRQAIASRGRRRPPWWARLAGRVIAVGVLLVAIRDGLRR